MTSRRSFFSYLQPFTYAIFSLFCISYPCLAQDRSSSVVALAEYKGTHTGLANFASGVVVNLPNNQVVIVTARHSFDDKEKPKGPVNLRLPVGEFDSLPQTIPGGVIPPERLRLITSENADFAILVLSDQDSELMREYSVSQNPTQLAVDALQVMGYPGFNPDVQGEAIKLVTVDAIAIPELASCEVPDYASDDASINYRQRQPSGRLFQAGMSGGGVFDAQGNWVGIHLAACQPDSDTPSGSEGSAMSADDIFTWINKENQFGNIQFNDAIRKSNETNRITQPHDEVLSDFLETEVSPDLKQPIGGQW